MYLNKTKQKMEEQLLKENEILKQSLNEVLSQLKDHDGFDILIEGINLALEKVK